MWLFDFGSEEEAFLNGNQRMELVVELSRNTYNISQYRTLQRSSYIWSGIHTAECLSVNIKKLLHSLQNIEKGVVRIILGPNVDGDGIYKTRAISELYFAEGIWRYIREKTYQLVWISFRSDSILTKKKCATSFTERKTKMIGW